MYQVIKSIPHLSVHFPIWFSLLRRCETGSNSMASQCGQFTWYQPRFHSWVQLLRCRDLYNLLFTSSLMISGKKNQEQVIDRSAQIGKHGARDKFCACYRTSYDMRLKTEIEKFSLQLHFLFSKFQNFEILKRTFQLGMRCNPLSSERPAAYVNFSTVRPTK